MQIKSLPILSHVKYKDLKIVKIKFHKYLCSDILAKVKGDMENKSITELHVQVMYVCMMFLYCLKILYCIKSVI